MGGNDDVRIVKFDGILSDELEGIVRSWEDLNHAKRRTHATAHNVMTLNKHLEETPQPYDDETKAILKVMLELAVIDMAVGKNKSVSGLTWILTPEDIDERINSLDESAYSDPELMKLFVEYLARYAVEMSLRPIGEGNDASTSYLKSIRSLVTLVYQLFSNDVFSYLDSPIRGAGLVSYAKTLEALVVHALNMGVSRLYHLDEGNPIAGDRQGELPLPFEEFGLNILYNSWVRDDVSVAEFLELRRCLVDYGSISEEITVSDFVTGYEVPRVFWDSQLESALSTLRLQDAESKRRIIVDLIADICDPKDLQSLYSPRVLSFLVPALLEYIETLDFTAPTRDQLITDLNTYQSQEA